MRLMSFFLEWAAFLPIGQGMIIQIKHFETKLIHYVLSSFQVRASYATHMRENKKVDHLLENLFCLMPQVPTLQESSKESSVKSSTKSKSTQVTMFTEEPQLKIKGMITSIEMLKFATNALLQESRRNHAWIFLVNPNQFKSLWLSKDHSWKLKMLVQQGFSVSCSREVGHWV